MDELGAQTRGQLEAAIGQMVNDRFYSLIDNEKAPVNHSFIQLAKLGKASMLSGKLERHLKTDGKNIFYANRSSKSHMTYISFCL